MPYQLARDDKMRFVRIQATTERFWSHVDVAGPDDCWMWTGPVVRKQSGGDRGQLSIGRAKSVRAHRYSLELALGRPIAPGLQANHRCHVSLCVNPAHLYEGTQKQNISDMDGAHRRITKRGEPPRVGCTIEGCGRPHCGHGLCAFHWQRKRLKGSPV